MELLLESPGTLGSPVFDRVKGGKVQTPPKKQICRNKRHQKCAVLRIAFKGGVRFLNCNCRFFRVLYQNLVQNACPHYAIIWPETHTKIWFCYHEIQEPLEVTHGPIGKTMGDEGRLWFFFGNKQQNGYSSCERIYAIFTWLDVSEPSFR